MTQQIRHYALLYLKGMAMGAADVVPGVSGGTIAFISGIYEELLDSIRSVDLAALKTLFSQGPPAFWRQINGNFLLALFAGILTSIFSLARLVSYSLEHHPQLVWSFFFGLIVASIIYIIRQQPHWRPREWSALALGCALALAVSFSPAYPVGSALPVVFGAGMLAICAMILPGISGSFILLLLGMYPVIIEAVTALQFSLLGVFALGCMVGLLLFSRLLSWLLHHYHSETLALLIGFLIGSLAVVWPWKRPLEVVQDAHGRELVLSQELLTPGLYQELVGDPQLIWGLALMALGLLLVLGLEYLGERFGSQQG